MVTASSEGSGRVTGCSSGWYDKGTAFVVAAEADEYHHFEQWTGTVNCTSNPLALTIDEPHTLTAVFAATLTLQGTPEWWLARYGYTNDFDMADVGDPDHDGLYTWQEWIAGTDPTDGKSALSVDIVPVSASEFVLLWAGASNRVYEIDRATNLYPLHFEAIATNLAAGQPSNVYTDQVSGVEKAFYRVTVDLQ